MHLTIAHLYPLSMSTYGDAGNISCLVERCAWRGIEVNVISADIGDPLPENVDLYFFGGGQDAAQSSVAEDFLQEKAPGVISDVKKGVPLLSICGGYQLLGKEYHPADSEPIKGAGLFPVTTTASAKRMIGDIILEADPSFGFSKQNTLVGFENHSGATNIVDPSLCTPLGAVRHGYGNNGSDKTEGCVIHNAIGCYLHGSLLPKNPHLADWLIEKACKLHDSSYQLSDLEDEEEWQAHKAIVGRYL
jgi:CobQ-like glutamine amidotransferase family enzyme